MPEHSYSLGDFQSDHDLFAGETIFDDAFPEQVTLWVVVTGGINDSLERT